MNIQPSESDAWTISEGNQGGHPTQIRHRPNMAKHVGHPDYPRRLTITWDYESEPGANGLPSSKVLDEMHSFETTICDAFENNCDAVFVFAFTSNGNREWHFYIRDVEVVGDILNRTLKPGLPIDIAVEDDPEWSEFSSVLDMVTG